MAQLEKLNDPWLIATWPGMGNVSLIAGTYAVNGMQMQRYVEFPGKEFFDVDHVDIHNGVAIIGQSPRNIFYVRKDPAGKRDLLLLVGEAQPSNHRYPFCRRLMESAVAMGVTRVFTFAAMATQLRPSQSPRVFGAATNNATVGILEKHGVEVLKEGQVSGLNGLLLAAAQDRNIPAACLLGEMPFFAINLPNPKAAAAVLHTFSRIAGIEIDTSELEQQATEVDQKLEELLEKMGQGSLEEGYETGEAGAQDVSATQKSPSPARARQLSEEETRRVEGLFDAVRQDRSRAMELKQELDRLGVFSRYEDRFLDLFKKTD